MRNVIFLVWLLLVGLLAAGTELRACGWQAEGLQYAPWEMYCNWATACGGQMMCESGSCHSWAGCIGWWQFCVFAPLCGVYSECQNTEYCA